MLMLGLAQTSHFFMLWYIILPDSQQASHIYYMKYENTLTHLCAKGLVGTGGGGGGEALKIFFYFLYIYYKK